MYSFIHTTRTYTLFTAYQASWIYLWSRPTSQNEHPTTGEADRGQCQTPLRVSFGVWIPHYSFSVLWLRPVQNFCQVDGKYVFAFYVLWILPRFYTSQVRIEWTGLIISKEKIIISPLESPLALALTYLLYLLALDVGLMTLKVSSWFPVVTTLHISYTISLKSIVSIQLWSTVHPIPCPIIDHSCKVESSALLIGEVCISWATFSSSSNMLCCCGKSNLIHKHLSLGDTATVSLQNMHKRIVHCMGEEFMTQYFWLTAQLTPH